jgi:hypothetical protein
MDPIDTIIDVLPALLSTLKDAEVARFRYGELEIEFPCAEPETPSVGFVPTEKQAKTQAAEDKDEKSSNPYVRAFGGKPPSFNKG